MPKILWVALPLLLAAAVLALQVLRGRAPSRSAINIVSSVLLLAYVATTASLGIFWVANQQLPVFDWHYLFGYGTVLLVSLHLAFNFPLVWRFFARRPTRPRGGADAGAATAAATRRRLLGPSACSRRPARRSCSACATAAASSSSSHRRPARRRRSGARRRGAGGGTGRRRSRSSSASMPSPAHPRRRADARPQRRLGRAAAAVQASCRRTRTRLPASGAARPGSLDLASLGSLLWHTAGVTENRGGLALRASPSSGALFATELYVLVRSLPGLAPGALHYDPESHALERLGAASVERCRPARWAATRRAMRRCSSSPPRSSSARGTSTATAPIATCSPTSAMRSRTCASRPGRSACRRASCRASTRPGWPACSASTRRRKACWPSLRSAASSAGARRAATLTPASSPLVEAAAIATPAGPLAAVGHAPRRHTAAEPRVTAPVHAATRCAPPHARVAPADRCATPRRRARDVRALVVLPATELVTSDWLRVIAARRSVRRYAGAPLPWRPWPRCWRAWRPAGPRCRRRCASTSSSMRSRPGARAYRYQRGRTSAAAAPRTCLDGPGGDARRRARPGRGRRRRRGVRAGDRSRRPSPPTRSGRRAATATLSRSRAGRRARLPRGAARGLGACAVGAFYDDEAAALVGVDPAREWVVHFAALGVKGLGPARKSRPPGDPRLLRLEFLQQPLRGLGAVALHDPALHRLERQRLGRSKARDTQPLLPRP